MLETRATRKTPEAGKATEAMHRARDVSTEEGTHLAAGKATEATDVKSKKGKKIPAAGKATKAMHLIASDVSTEEEEGVEDPGGGRLQSARGPCRSQA